MMKIQDFLHFKKLQSAQWNFPENNFSDWIGKLEIAGISVSKGIFNNIEKKLFKKSLPRRLLFTPPSTYRYI